MILTSQIPVRHRSENWEKLYQKSSYRDPENSKELHVADSTQAIHFIHKIHTLNFHLPQGKTKTVIEKRSNPN